MIEILRCLADFPGPDPWSLFLKTGWYDREFKTGACLPLSLVITLTMLALGSPLTNTDRPTWRRQYGWNGGIIETSLMDSTFTIFQTDCSQPTMLHQPLLNGKVNSFHTFLGTLILTPIAFCCYWKCCCCCYFYYSCSANSSTSAASTAGCYSCWTLLLDSVAAAAATGGRFLSYPEGSPLPVKWLCHVSISLNVKLCFLSQTGKSGKYLEVSLLLPASILCVSMSITWFTSIWYLGACSDHFSLN